MKVKGNLSIITSLIISLWCTSSVTAQNKAFTRADTLRGSITQFRQGWDVLHYDLSVGVDINNKSIKGSNKITYYESLPVRQMQIDLQTPLMIDSILTADGEKLTFLNEGNAWFARLRPDGAMIKFKPGIRSLTVYYHGKPHEALRAPWDGGVVWSKDAEGRPYVATACQGIGASIWWPCKDHQSDEPDSGVVMHFTVPDTLVAVGNGRLKNVSVNKGTKTWTWEVKNPINTYGVTMDIGKYVNWSDAIMGEKGKLDLGFYVLDYNLEKAKKQFQQAKQMLHSFEYWFGKYPWYEDSYKLIETPFLGMEHQSGVAYGNGFANGYRGRDLSGTGWGLKWDFIIVHESGHEWFGNNITSKDIADMWIHESFTNYSETLFTQTYYGKQAADEYCYGIRNGIKNDKPIIGVYGVQSKGSENDMYPKGANMLHTIRKAIDNDTLFRKILRGLNSTFYHQTVTSKQIEDYISKESKIDFSKVFDQYLRTTKVPVLEYYFSADKKKVFYHWANCVTGFNLPLVLKNNSKIIRLNVDDNWKNMNVNKETALLFDKGSIEMNYYIEVKEKSK